MFRLREYRKKDQNFRISSILKLIYSGLLGRGRLIKFSSPNVSATPPEVSSVEKKEKKC